jgi:hypothetical protein
MGHRSEKPSGKNQDGTFKKPTVSRRIHGSGYMDWVNKAYDMAKPHLTRENAGRAYDMGRSFIPEKYRGYTDAARRVVGGAAKAKKKLSPYNLLVSSVSKEKFPGDVQAMRKAVKYIKENNLYKGGHYVKGEVGMGRSGGGPRSGGMRPGI